MSQFFFKITDNKNTAEATMPWDLGLLQWLGVIEHDKELQSFDTFFV